MTNRTTLLAQLTHDQADEAGRAAYAAYRGMAAVDMEPDWGREGYKIEAGVWQAVARAVHRILAAELARDDVAQAVAWLRDMAHCVECAEPIGASPHRKDAFLWAADGIERGDFKEAG